MRGNVSYGDFQTSVGSDHAKVNLGGQLDDSGNVIIGIDNHDIDLFDNPFVQINAYSMKQDYALNTPIALRKCAEEDLTRMMSKDLIKFYPNSLCIKNKDQVDVENDWFEDHF